MPFKRLRANSYADIGIGALIIFIAMIMIAGVTASVMIQTMTNLQKQAIDTSTETLKDISSGVKVLSISGYVSNSTITQLAIFVTTMAASDAIDLNYGILSLSDSTKKVILNYTSTCFSSSVSNGLFDTLNASNLSSSDYGLLVIRDIDDSCNALEPVINEDDLVVLIVNTTACFSGIETHTEVSGELYPEHGVKGVIGFTTPSVFVKTIVELSS
jgi:flagellin FlaB